LKTISFRDLQLAEELKHLNEIQMLHRSNDDLMKSVLEKCGFDTDYETEYIPSKHRDMQGKVAIGYQAVGDISINRKTLNSCVSDITDRMVAASYQDPSLTRELASMMGNTVNYKSLLEAEDSFDEIESEAPVEEDYEWTVAQIKQLEMIRDQIRGSNENKD
jgi:hypothetical protein